MAKKRGQKVAERLRPMENESVAWEASIALKTAVRLYDAFESTQKHHQNINPGWDLSASIESIRHAREQAKRALERIATDKLRSDQ